MNRREFLIHTGSVTAGCLAGSLLPGRLRANPAPDAIGRRGVAIVSDPSDPVAAAKPAQWAGGQLRQALAARGMAVHEYAKPAEAHPADLCVVVAGATSPLARAAGVDVPAAAESLVIAPARLGARTVLFAGGRDVRGLVYALLELADVVASEDAPGAALQPAVGVSEQPANRVRSVMRLFVSDVEDKPWYNDRDFWRRYLTRLATERFNRFNLALGLGYDAPSGLRDTYFYFAYPFLLAVPGFDVRATNLPDAERDHNLAMLRFISDEAAARSLDFQLGLWTHAYRWINSPDANHTIEGLTPQTQGPYCRDALALLLKACPNITGVTFRIHGESGVPEGSYGLWRTIFDGCRLSGRRVGIDLHAKGIDQPTIDAALSTGLPLTISPKFWAEHLGLPYHQAAIRPTELPKRAKGPGWFAQSEGARSFLRYGYGDLLKFDRPYGIVHRVWPGTQRVLLWGDPTFAAGYGRAMGFCGSQGGEVFDPLSFKGRKGSGLPGGRDGYADASLHAVPHEFDKYRYTYRLWGRMLFNAATAPRVWQRQLETDYGAAAEAVEAALGHASRILPLFTTAHTPSAANNNYWPEMYVNMSIVDDSHPQPYTDTPSPKRFGTVSPLDPQLFARVDDFADELLRGEVSGKYSPVEVAQWMEDLATAAADGLGRADAGAGNRTGPAFRRLATDVEVQIGLGRFFGRKLRAAVLFALFERTGDPATRDLAVKTYRAAREAWVRVIAATAGPYVRDMTYGDGWFQRGDWADRLAAIDEDIVLMEQRSVPPAAGPQATPAQTAAFIQEVLGRPTRPTRKAAHVPPVAFRRGQPVNLTLTIARGDAPPVAVRLCYRHTQQAEAWQVTEMPSGVDGYSAAIPGAYTEAPYPLEYYFEISERSGRSWLYPGFDANLANQPYFVLS